MTRPVALLMNADGTPATIALASRESESAPGRIKAAFVAPLEKGAYVTLPDGTKKGVRESGDVMLGSEFRIEVTG